MTAIVNANLFRIVSAFVSTDPIRYYLNGVLIQKHPVKGVYLVGSDGHKMIVAHDETGTTTLDDVIVKLDKPTLSACKSAKGEPSARILKIESDLRASIIMDESDSYPMVTCCDSIIVGIYPDWKMVLPSDHAEQSPSSFNAAYISDFSKAAKELTDQKTGLIRVVAKGDGPALILFPRSNYAFGVLMPVRDDMDDKTPSWVNMP